METKDEQGPISSTVENLDIPIAGETEPLWTVSDVARYLQLEPETVRVMARNQEIPAFKLKRSNRWRFRKVDVQKWVIATAEHGKS